MEGFGIVAVGEIAQGGAAGALAAVLGGLDDRGPVLGACHRGEAAGGGDVQRGAAFEALLGPFEHRLHAPPRTGPGRSHLALPEVEAAGFLGGTHARGDRFAWVIGPQPPGPGFEGVAHGGGQFGLALGVGREPCQHGSGEGAQARVVVPERQLVERPGPIGPGGRVPAQQGERVQPAVGGEVPEDGEREART